MEEPDNVVRHRKSSAVSIEIEQASGPSKPSDSDKSGLRGPNPPVNVGPDVVVTPADGGNAAPQQVLQFPAVAQTKKQVRRLFSLPDTVLSQQIISSGLVTACSLRPPPESDGSGSGRLRRSPLANMWRRNSKQSAAAAAAADDVHDGGGANQQHRKLRGRRSKSPQPSSDSDSEKEPVEPVVDGNVEYRREEGEADVGGDGSPVEGASDASDDDGDGVGGCQEAGKAEDAVGKSKGEDGFLKPAVTELGKDAGRRRGSPVGNGVVHGNGDARHHHGGGGGGSSSRDDDDDFLNFRQQRTDTGGRRGSGTEMEDVHLNYSGTLMYGRYTRDLGEYIKAEARRLKRLEKQRKREEKLRTKELRKYRGKWATRFLNVVGFVWRNTFARLGEDWVFLAILGFIMALISFCVEYLVGLCNKARLWLYSDLSNHVFLQFLAWVSFPLFLILFSVGFTHIVARQATGSGIPEMKTILRGVALKEYLTFRTLVAKVIGLTATLGAGMPLGKEGPFVHIASIVATLLGKLVTSFKGIYENERRNTEMLAAACAVGVACTFYAPIGGVLFSIEVTAVYFAVRNYWRGFFAAVNAALIFRLLGIWLKEEATITALFATHFAANFPFDPQELVVFSLMGVFSGFTGAFWVWLHRRYVKFIRKSKRMKRFLERNRFLYPGVVALTISALTCPLSLGQFMAGDLTTHGQVDSLFANFSFVIDDLEIDQQKIRDHWATKNSNVFLSLFVFFVMTGLMTIPASTMPVPSGIFIPMFKMGAAFGRVVGEAMAVWFPRGVRYGGFVSTIQPGGYAIVGAAAFSGAVTHTISTSVIVFEMTGQITHILPVMIAVLIANAIAQLLQPSIYDSIIQIKKLPYLPDILSSKSAAYSICVEDFMVRNVKYIWYKMSYRELREVLRDSKKLRSLPVVDSKEQMILLGSIPRLELVRALEKHIGRERRMKAASRWHRMAQKALLESKVREFAASREAMSGADSAADAESISSSTRLRSGEDDDRDDGLELVTKPAAGGSSSNAAASSSTPAVGDGTENRRLSRFEVVPAAGVGGDDAGNDDPSVASKRQQHAQELLMEFSVNKDYSATNSLPAPGMRRPIKSILKKTPSFHFPSGSPQETFDERRMAASVKNSPYGTMDSTRMRKAMDVWKALGRAASQLSGMDKGPYGTWTPKRVQLPTERVIDLPPDEQRKWEEQELGKEVDFALVSVDPAPFQLVEKTTLLKVHSLFSLLSLKLAYVTALGKLIGVVALRDLRGAIEGVNAGHFTATPTTQPLLPPPQTTKLLKPPADGGATTDDETDGHETDKDDDVEVGRRKGDDPPPPPAVPVSGAKPTNSPSSTSKKNNAADASSSASTLEAPSPSSGSGIRNSPSPSSGGGRGKKAGSGSGSGSAARSQLTIEMEEKSKESK